MSRYDYAIEKDYHSPPTTPSNRSSASAGICSTPTTVEGSAETETR